MRQRSYRELRWPYDGLHVGRSFHGQASDTTVDCLNVRNYDPLTGRSRGAQRAGLSRFNAATADGTGSKPIQDMISVVTVPVASNSSTSLQARVLKLISVCNGTVQTFTTSGFTTVTSGSSALDTNAPVIFSAQLFGKVYYADGTNAKYYTGAAMATWTPSAGSLPSTGAGTYKPRLIEMWRTRIVLSGVRGDDQNWFMSKAGDPNDWDYGATPSAIMAVAGNNSNAGYVGDVINCMIPYDDDLLIFGCDHSIWQMTGDPAAGGAIDQVSDVTGMAFGRPYCKAYDGSIYFMGSRGGIYRMAAGSKPERISAERIEESLRVVDLNTSIVRCVYDDVTVGIHFFITPLNGTSSSDHFFYDLRRNAFFKDRFADPQHNPIAVVTVDGDAPDDRVVLLGGFDRRIRKIDYGALSDDTEAIDSYVTFGPLKVDEGQKVRMNELLVTLSDESDGAYYEVYGAMGTQAAAERGQLFFSGDIGPGRNSTDSRRASGSAIYIKLGNQDFDQTFSYETAYVSLQGCGVAASRRAE
jgi:hypothetical protein